VLCRILVILPGLPEFAAELSEGEKLVSAVEANVRWKVADEGIDGRIRLAFALAQA
jgi:hypothetical protein